MQIGLGLWLGTRQVGGFNPAAVLFGAGEPGGWYDPSDISTLFQDTAGTVPVTAAGQTVARINDKSGRGNHLTQATAADRPLYQIDEIGLPYLAFITNKWFISPTITPGIDKAQVFAGVRKLSDAAENIVLEQGIAGTNPLAYTAISVPAAADAWQTSMRAGGAEAISRATLNPEPQTAVVSSIADYAGATLAADIQIRVNQVATTGNAGSAVSSAAFGAYPLYVGRRGGTTLPFNGRLYQLLVRFGANLDAATIAATETFVNSRTGAYV